MRIFLILCLSEALFCSGIFGHSPKGEHHHAKDHHDDDDDDDDDAKASHLCTLCTDTSPLKRITPGNIKFAYRLYTHLATKYSNDNIFFSPVSISMIFSMLSAGAKCQTKTEILEGLGFNTSSVSEQAIHGGFQQFIKILEASKCDVELHTANALIAHTYARFLEKYLEKLEFYYHSNLLFTDFHNSEKAVNEINTYVARKTKDKIKNLLDRVDPDTVLLLVNTMYFKGVWEKSFETVEEESDFHVDENTVIKVSMMRSKGTYRVAHDHKIGCTVVKIPYKGNVSAVLILPAPGKLHNVERDLQKVLLLKLKPKKINLLVPKFSISPSLDLKEELREMGIVKVFTGDADLSGINGDHDLKVSMAVHKSVVIVNENGTEAAEVSAAGVILESSRKNPPLVAANRPFLMTILDTFTGNILFAGRIMRPEN